MAAALVGLQFMAAEAAVARPGPIWFGHINSLPGLQKDCTAAGGELRNISHMNGVIYRADCWEK